MQSQIHLQLSLSVAVVIASQLFPTLQAGRRFPALEILVASDAILNLIRRALDHQIRSQLMISRNAGMVDGTVSLAALVRSKIVALEGSLAHCSRPNELRDLLG